ncbi:MAG TPA: hypothetical protein VG845_02320 [Dehalococcoidia bacterium]|jgi:hypothetical protein|nr:hypothetical protein [Dehalococcoidia bacterium]
MTERDKERLKWKLMGLAACGIAVAQVASVVHMAEAYSWANEPWVAFSLAVVTVMMSGVLLVLSIISPVGIARNSVLVVTGLLLVSEWFGNIGAGGLISETALPSGVGEFFGVSTAFARHAATVLFAGVIPVLVFVGIFALAKTAESLLNDSARASRSEHWLHSIQMDMEPESLSMPAPNN